MRLLYNGVTLAKDVKHYANIFSRTKRLRFAKPLRDGQAIILETEKESISGTVIHHINKLMDSDIVISQKNRYKLRTRSLHSLIKELETDVEEALQEMERIAKKIDKQLK